MELIFDLAFETNRPIIKLDYIFPGCTALLDTGALIPVWTKEARLLEALGATLDRKKCIILGIRWRNNRRPI